MIDYSNNSEVSAMRKSRGIQHQDRFKTNFMDLDLKYKPNRNTTSQKLLKQGYRILFRNGKKYAVKGSEEVVCT